MNDEQRVMKNSDTNANATLVGILSAPAATWNHNLK